MTLTAISTDFVFLSDCLVGC